ncbi:hypothetical protein M8J75_001896 [Diaphorina citri]|nr:hypothetical protein M8J75_001896 [Diaphorina citri]
MAWFGGGLSKLTDEISNLGNLTREVLSDTLSNQGDEVSEVAEEALQRRPSNVPELEEKVKAQEDVIHSLQRENDLLMKKLNDQLLSLDQASPRTPLARSFQSAVDNDTWGDFDADDSAAPNRNAGGGSGMLFPGGDFEFDDDKETTQNELSALRQKIELLEKENEDLLRTTAEIPDLRSRIKQLHKENNLFQSIVSHETKRSLILPTSHKSKHPILHNVSRCLTQVSCYELVPRTALISS